MTAHILSLIEGRAHARRDRWTTSEDAVLPYPEDMKEPTIVSRYSRCGLESKSRHLLAPVLISVDGIKDTPSALARDYLIVKYRRPPKWTGNQRECVRGQLRPLDGDEGSGVLGHPIYVRPCNFSDGVYIDLKGAFWSVMVRVGWNVDYYPGKWVGIADPPLDFPFQDSKRARNSLVSIGIARTITMWEPGIGYELKVRPNPRANSQLYCLIMDTLHALAAEVVDAGACYVFADGYIAPDAKAAAAVSQVIKEWGFDFSLKGAGVGYVTNIGSYRVGAHKTRGTLARAKYRAIKPVDYHRWLREQMQWTRSEARWHDASVYRMAA